MSSASVFIEKVNNQWKVYVQSDSLERSQAVSILDLVMNEMEASPNNVVVQRVP
jgi:stage III sporulation protein AH